MQKSKQLSSEIYGALNTLYTDQNISKHPQRYLMPIPLLQSRIH